MEARCLECRAVVESRYRIEATRVLLIRRCPSCGETTSEVSDDPRYFRRAYSRAKALPSRPPVGMIVELLDGCNIECPTCIAGSSPLLSNARSVATIQSGVGSVMASQDLQGVMLSGGEPTVHPDLIEIMGAMDRLPLTRKILITNGIRIAHDRAFSDELVAALYPDWEVFLQFDALDAEILRNIRGDDYTSERMASLGKLNDAGVSMTLVAVAKKGVSLDHLYRTLRIAVEYPFVAGVQIQPIREAGRLLNYSSANSCTTSDVIRTLGASVPGICFAPHPRSPMNVSMALGRRTGTGIVWNKRPSRYMDDSFYIEETGGAKDSFRVSIVEYSDDQNWTSVRRDTSPLAVLMGDGSARRVDDHWEPEPVSVQLGRAQHGAEPIVV